MKKTIGISIVFTLLLSVAAYPQITFEKGYFISDSGDSVECLIRNSAWVYNPTQFQYKLSEEGELKVGSIQDVKEFCVYGDNKYVRASVNIDLSSSHLDEMTSDRNPTYTYKTLFLRVIVEGPATLLAYKKDNYVERFLFHVKGSDIHQLVYKAYKVTADEFAYNNMYRQQLINEVLCKKSVRDLENLDYNERELKKFFMEYNQCIDSNYVITKASRHDWLYLSVKPALTYFNADLSNTMMNDYEPSFDHKLGFRLGIEAEYFLPFNKNKWSIVIEPNFYGFRAENTTASLWIGDNVHTKIDYKAFDLPVGLRHSFYLNTKSSVFINAFFILTSDFNSSIKIYEDQYLVYDLETSSGHNVALGIGYEYNQRFSFEFRYNTPRNLLRNKITWSSDLNIASFILGYRFIPLH